MGALLTAAVAPFAGMGAFGLVAPATAGGPLRATSPTRSQGAKGPANGQRSFLDAGRGGLPGQDGHRVPPDRPRACRGTRPWRHASVAELAPARRGALGGLHRLAPGSPRAR